MKSIWIIIFLLLPLSLIYSQSDTVQIFFRSGISAAYPVIGVTNEGIECQHRTFPFEIIDSVKTWNKDLAEKISEISGNDLLYKDSSFIICNIKRRTEKEIKDPFRPLNYRYLVIHYADNPYSRYNFNLIASLWFEERMLYKMGAGFGAESGTLAELTYNFNFGLGGLLKFNEQVEACLMLEYFITLDPQAARSEDGSRPQDALGVELILQYKVYGHLLISAGGNYLFKEDIIDYKSNSMLFIGIGYWLK